MFYHALTGKNEPIRDLLWHNDSPTVALNLTNIPGDYSKYSKIYVKCRLSTTIDYEAELILKKSDTYSPGLVVFSTGSLVYRTMSLSNSTITIGDATSINSLGASSVDNNNCIVTDIYGIE